MLVSEAKVRIVFQSMNKVADFVKSGELHYIKVRATRRQAEGRG